MVKAELAPAPNGSTPEINHMPHAKRGAVRISQAITEKWKDENYRSANSGKKRALTARFKISLGITRILRDPEIRRSYSERLDKINKQRYGTKRVPVEDKKPGPKRSSDARRVYLDLARDARYAERRLWITARKTGLLDEIINRGLLSLEELSLLYGYFEVHTGKLSTKIMDKFSIAVANLS